MKKIKSDYSAIVLAMGSILCMVLLCVVFITALCKHPNPTSAHYVFVGACVIITTLFTGVMVWCSIEEFNRLKPTN